MGPSGILLDEAGETPACPTGWKPVLLSTPFAKYSRLTW